MSREVKKSINGEKNSSVIGVICTIIAISSLGMAVLIYNDQEASLILAMILPVLCLINIILAVVGLYRRDTQKALPLFGLIITISIMGFLMFHLYVVLSEARRLFPDISGWTIPL